MNLKTSNGRLLALAEFLDKLPPKRWNFRDWVDRDWRGASDFSCGTKACAAGWATTIPRFRRLGLRLMRTSSSEFAPGIPVNIKTSSNNENAIGEIFGLSAYEARTIFIYGHLPYKSYYMTHTPKQFSKLLRNFVKTRV